MDKGERHKGIQVTTADFGRRERARKCMIHLVKIQILNHCVFRRRDVLYGRDKSRCARRHHYGISEQLLTADSRQNKTHVYLTVTYKKTWPR